MIRGWICTLVAGMTLTAVANAQAPAWQFRWQPRQVLTYRVEHTTSATEVVGKDKNESKTKLNLTKNWQVLEVDASGVATLQLSLSAMRLETTTPGGGTLLFDSDDAQKSDPELRKELGKFMGQVLAVLRLDSQGKVVEVKESKNGPASRFESELPFVLQLPATGPSADQNWERAYKITLEPPQGTGEKYDAVQNCVCKSVDASTVTIALTTMVKNMPENVLDQVPLLQMQPTGEVVFDLHNGRLRKATLHIEKELKGHQGDGSSYRFQSDYTEEFVEGK
jgi:hypothetical protein